jgi:hypothetical protein
VKTRFEHVILDIHNATETWSTGGMADHSESSAVGALGNFLATPYRVVTHEF